MPEYGVVYPYIQGLQIPNHQVIIHKLSNYLYSSLNFKNDVIVAFSKKTIESGVITAYKSPQLILSLYPYISSQDLGLWKTNQSQPTSQK